LAEGRRDDILPGVIVNTRRRGPSVAPSILRRRPIAFLFAAVLSSVAAGQALHAPTDKLKQWQDTKFGLFIHFGPWSQTESGMIWPLATTKDVKQRQQYFELYRTFNPVNFDADAWAKAARASGAKYVVFTTKHHDGFCNFDSALTDYKITSPNCPYSASAQADLTADFVKATRAQNLLVGLYYSHIDWHYPTGNWHRDTHIDESFVHDHPTQWRNFAAYEQGQVRELVTKYGPLDLFWFDVSWPHDGDDDAKQMLTMMRSLQPNMLINDRGTGEFADFVTPEQGIPNPIPPGPWETCFTISEGNGFWYKGPSAKYKSAATLIRTLADIVSKGGNLLLNVGPKPDGSWPAEESERLQQIGSWLSVNGEAIYGCTRSGLATDPSWGRITQKGSRLYAIIFDPTTPMIDVPTERLIVAAHRLDGGESITFLKTADGVSVPRLGATQTQARGLPVVIVFDTAPAHS
jgi:alpha-L-fucosidase